MSSSCGNISAGLQVRNPNIPYLHGVLDTRTNFHHVRSSCFKPLTHLDRRQLQHAKTLEIRCGVTVLEGIALTVGPPK